MQPSLDAGKVRGDYGFSRPERLRKVQLPFSGDGRRFQRLSVRFQFRSERPQPDVLAGLGWAGLGPLHVGVAAAATLCGPDMGPARGLVDGACVARRFDEGFDSPGRTFPATGVTAEFQGRPRSASGSFPRPGIASRSPSGVAHPRPQFAAPVPRVARLAAHIGDLPPELRGFRPGRPLAVDRQAGESDAHSPDRVRLRALVNASSRIASPRPLTEPRNRARYRLPAMRSIASMAGSLRLARDSGEPLAARGDVARPGDRISGPGPPVDAEIRDHCGQLARKKRESPGPASQGGLRTPGARALSTANSIRSICWIRRDCGRRRRRGGRHGQRHRGGGPAEVSGSAARPVRTHRAAKDSPGARPALAVPRRHPVGWGTRH